MRFAISYPPSIQGHALCCSWFSCGDQDKNIRTMFSGISRTPLSALFKRAIDKQPGNKQKGTVVASTDGALLELHDVLSQSPRLV